MTTRLPVVLFLSVSMVTVAITIGCTQTAPQPAGSGAAPAAPADADYDPHDRPITDEQKAELRDQTAKFADAVAAIKQFRDEIAEETKAGIPENPYRAHQALDKVDLVLQWLPESARQSAVAKEHWESINTSANTLRTLFEQVHQNIDDRRDPDFAAVGEEIDQRLASLTEIAAARPSGAEAED
ncbi:MAG: hypothetical protein KJ000_33275 [Pirellulaceae bacterium]|nr:hypothetical protein [Pirellulaceae bacterium]